ncbi:hypothetical protein M2401_006308 [Pseudomonas sp. JUb42]|uniref:hypothetical protein n=1 Tax=Pseudomonas sp. JUb42 TaxID=2940611 RepID=UPI00216816D0|nr:hypothetical protein [Pseudomonas sp. JUb42]MCS3472543.1 hypothetical protein [Pseudomonas sp. JUb42]
MLAADYSGSLYGKYRACWIATKNGERLSGTEKCLEQDIHSFKRQGGVDEIVIGPITRQPTAMRIDRQPQAPLCAARSLILLTVISDELNLISHRTQPQASHGRMRILLINESVSFVPGSEEAAEFEVADAKIDAALAALRDQRA